MDDCPHTSPTAPDAFGWRACMACGVSLPPAPAVAVRAPVRFPAAPPAPSGKPVRMPVQWSKALEDKIVADIDSGASRFAAAGAHGVNAVVFKRWLRSEHEPYLTFAERVEAAVRSARVRAEVRVAQDKPEKWLAVHARESPDEPGWNQGNESRVTIQGGAPIVIQHTAADFRRMTDEELASRLADLDTKALLEEHVEDAEFTEAE